MKALDADYNQSLAKTRVSVSGKFTTKTVTYSSDLTLSEIDARYPRAEWLQLLLDKGITIDDSLEYASLLSKAFTLWHSWKTIQIYSSQGFSVFHQRMIGKPIKPLILISW